MSQRAITVTTPQPDCARAISPSPAQDALQSNLTLTRKKSWFSSARNIISRGSSHAKGKADLPKDNGGAAELQDGGLDDDGAAGQIQTDSDNAASTTPLRPKPARQHTFTPKSAISSLRAHLPISSHRHKRPPLAQITGNEGNTNMVAVIETIDSPANEDHPKAVTGEQPHRSNAVKSVVGSIRKISRAAAVRRQSPYRSDQAQLASPTKLPPLPSSPMDIPAPPALQLDLGPANLVSPGFGASIGQTNETELMRATNPNGFGNVRSVPTYYTRLLDDDVADHITLNEQKRLLQQSDLLQLPVDEFGFSVPSGPSTPMPGTDQVLDLDGANEATELFERSVEYKRQNQEKEQHKLKKMASLDALAEECVSTPRGSVKPSAKPNDQHTVHKPPVDMPELSRQIAHLQTPSAGHRDPVKGHWQTEDPFAPGNVVGDLAEDEPSSPRKSIKLPFRPKITLQSSDSTRRQTLAEGVPLSYKQLVDATKGQGSKDSQVSSDLASHGSGHSQNIRDIDQPGAIGDPETSEQLPASSGSPQSPDDVLDIGEYGEFKTQHIFGDLRKQGMPKYDEAEWSGGADLDASPTSASSVAAIYHRISKSQKASPERTRIGTTHTSDVGDVFWKFSIKDWMHGSEEAHVGTPAMCPSPRPQSTEMSLDSVSAHEDRATLGTSPTLVTSDRDPIENRLDLQLKRSRRDMRYNTSESENEPTHEDCAKDPTMLPLPLRPNLRIVTGSFKKKRDRHGGDKIQYNHAAPLKPNTRNSTVGMSSDSIETDLKNAIAEHYAFQAAMSGIEIGGSNSSPASETRALLQGVDEKLERRDSVVPMPGSSDLWQDMQQSVFDVPPEDSQNVSRDLQHHKGSSLFIGGDGNADGYVFRVENQEVKAEPPAREDTLDECLEMFKHYNKSQEIITSSKEQASVRPMNPFSSPDSGYRPDSSSVNSSPASPSKPRSARYRTRVNRH